MVFLFTAVITVAPSANWAVAATLPIASSGAYAKAPALGIRIGSMPHGRYDAITDVPGVKVGHVTHIKGSGKLIPGVGPVRTGVTAIIPRANVWHKHLFAAAWPLNGNGEMTGTLWVNESGWLEVPIMLTDTLSVGRVLDGTLSWLITQYPGIGDTDDVPNPVVAETDDAFLNDQQGRHNTAADAIAAIDAATSGPVAQGNVGAGTGSTAYGFKGGIGSASRMLPAADGGYTVGVLVNINTLGRREDFSVDGVPVGAQIKDLQLVQPTARDGSVIIVVATDAPLLHDQLLAVAKHAALGLARTGGSARESSGDLILAFSTANVVPYGEKALTYAATALDRGHINPIFWATIDATNEAVVNAMLAAQTMTGSNGDKAYALPHDRLLQIMHRYGR